ncbi:MAG TPA: hypothetical protein PKZ32_22440 [Candidatus Melainabacteria bacterium]|nr:hypothetical protein [Candidatus Melainabacteria bacterium]
MKKALVALAVLSLCLASCSTTETRSTEGLRGGHDEQGDPLLGRERQLGGFELKTALCEGPFGLKPTSFWSLECEPPILHKNAKVAPILALQRVDNDVRGTASFHIGWCDVGPATEVSVSGKWTGKDIELDLDTSEPVKLNGSFDTVSWKFTGTATGNRTFVLRPDSFHR